MGTFPVPSVDGIGLGECGHDRHDRDLGARSVAPRPLRCAAACGARVSARTALGLSADRRLHGVDHDLHRHPFPTRQRISLAGVADRVRAGGRARGAVVPRLSVPEASALEPRGRPALRGVSLRRPAREQRIRDRARSAERLPRRNGARARLRALRPALVSDRLSPGLESHHRPDLRPRSERLRDDAQHPRRDRRRSGSIDRRGVRRRRERVDDLRRARCDRTPLTSNIIRAPGVGERAGKHGNLKEQQPVKEIVILDGARTPMAEYNGHFSDVSAIDLGAIAAKEALSRSGFAAEELDHVIVGNALQTSGDAIYGARHVGLKAGVPNSVPALTVYRLCGSGIQSIISGAEQIQLDEATTVLAGGMENMSQAPFVIRGARKGLKLGQSNMEDSLMVALLDTYAGLYMAQTSDNLARKYEISREQQDEYALRSQKCAGDAVANGRLQEEIVAVPVGRKSELITADDHMRSDTTMEVLGKLKPAFAKDGFVTAGNASGIVDGAAMLVVTTAEKAKEKGKTPLGRIVSWGVAGCDPEIMGIGPVPATHIALKKAGLKLDDIDLIEINEAFAGQILAVAKELGIDKEKLNVNGGAIALGHPLGASGTRLVLTLLYELRRRKLRYGLASACIGGGQGIAMIVENAA